MKRNTKPRLEMRLEGQIKKLRQQAKLHIPGYNGKKDLKKTNTDKSVKWKRRLKRNRLKKGDPKDIVPGSSKKIKIKK